VDINSTTLLSIVYCASWSLDLIVLLSGFLGRTVALPTLPSASTSANGNWIHVQGTFALSVHNCTGRTQNHASGCEQTAPVMADIRRIAPKPFLRLAFQ